MPSKSRKARQRPRPRPAAKVAKRAKHKVSRTTKTARTVKRSPRPRAKKAVTKKVTPRKKPTAKKAPVRGSKGSSLKPKAPARPRESKTTSRSTKASLAAFQPEGANRSPSSLAKHERNDVIVRRATTGGPDGRGESLTVIARDYGISRSTVRDIIRARLGETWTQDWQTRAFERARQRRRAARAAGIKPGMCIGCGVRRARPNWDKCGKGCSDGLKIIEGLKNPTELSTRLSAQLVLSPDAAGRVTAQDKVWARKVILVAKKGDVPMGLRRVIWRNSDEWRLIEKQGLKRWLPKGVHVIGRAS